MSNSNYSIGLQRLKSAHTAYCGLHNLAENWSWARDVNGWAREETETFASRDRDETDTLTIFLETRPRRDVGSSRDRDVETETTTLLFLDILCWNLRISSFLHGHWSSILDNRAETDTLCWLHLTRAMAFVKSCPAVLKILLKIPKSGAGHEWLPKFNGNSLSKNSSHVKFLQRSVQ